MHVFISAKDSKRRGTMQQKQNKHRSLLNPIYSGVQRHGGFLILTRIEELETPL